MNTLAIIHFAPLELYPPVQNLLHELEGINFNGRIFVFTNRANVNFEVFAIDSEKIKIIRIGLSDKRLKAFSRYENYLFFYIKCFVALVKHRATNILYFETLSSFPAYLYKRFFKTTCKLYIHYHEYTSPEEYQTGMKLAKYFHRLEKWLYPRSRWVSHTNKYRMDKFKEDIHPVTFDNEFILPNYPPKSWSRPPVSISTLPLRLVYVGALSLSTMFTKEFATWVIQQKGKVYWDIYSNNFDDDARDFLLGLNSDYIHLKNGVTYEKLPGVLKEYDAGIVLYRGHIQNYIYNAPNKLFEYLTSGLSVLFPTVMTGSLSYVTNDTYPRVIAADFTSLDDFIPEQFFNIKQKMRTFEFDSETALRPLLDALTW